MKQYPGIDISNWQGEITPQTAACFAQNCPIVVVRASLESPRHVALAKQQIEACQAAGLQVHGYIWMYPSWNPTQTVNDTMGEYGRYDLPWVWIDAEETADVADPKHNADWLNRAIARLLEHGRRAGIYTGAWWWNDPRYMGGSTAFKEVPLWYAEYDSNPDLYTWTPFGGWLNPAGKQWDVTRTLCDIGPIDRDTFAEWVYQPPPPPEPPSPPPTPSVLDLAREMRRRDEDDLATARAAWEAAKLSHAVRIAHDDAVIAALGG